MAWKKSWSRHVWNFEPRNIIHWILNASIDQDWYITLGNCETRVVWRKPYKTAFKEKKLLYFLNSKIKQKSIAEPGSLDQLLGTPKALLFWSGALEPHYFEAEPLKPLGTLIWNKSYCCIFSILGFAFGFRQKSIAEPGSLDRLLGISGALFILARSPKLRWSTSVTATTKLPSVTARQPEVMAEQTQLTVKQLNPRQHETNPNPILNTQHNKFHWLTARSLS